MQKTSSPTHILCIYDEDEVKKLFEQTENFAMKSNKKMSTREGRTFFFVGIYLYSSLNDNAHFPLKDMTRIREILYTNQHHIHSQKKVLRSLKLFETLKQHHKLFYAKMRTWDDVVIAIHISCKILERKSYVNFVQLSIF